jgi:putative transposase
VAGGDVVALCALTIHDCSGSICAMTRGPRLDAPGALHHVMVRGIERCKIFRSNKDREDLVGRLADILSATGTRVYAWCLLPNHFHLLVRTGKVGISRVMRRLLTGYAVSFNRRHKRVGHLFQNRFKSILAEEQPYFLQLVRYIHLNPVRVGLAKGREGLDGYRWAGHSALVGSIDRPWQDTDYVLRQFAGSAGMARRLYRQFVTQGVEEGRRPDLVGGGLIRSIGGREHLAELRRGRERWAYDERVLGSSRFVVELLEEHEQRCAEKEVLRRRRGPGLARLLEVVGDRLRLTTRELTSGTRRRDVVRARQLIAYVATSDLGCTAEEVARVLGVSRSSVSRGVGEGRALAEEMCWDVHELLQ